MVVRVIGAGLMFLLLSLMPVLAQDQPPSVDDIVAKMQSKLNLTQDQVTAVTPIIEKYISKHQELRQGVEDGTIERGDMRTQMKQLREDEKQELGQILSADQLSQWESMQKPMHQHSSEGGSNHGD